MASSYKLLNNDTGAKAQNSHNETEQEVSGSSHTKRVAITVTGAGFLMLGGAAMFFQRGSMSSTATALGGDRDAHGCIGSAGYSWCASMSECIRPWEHNLMSEQDTAKYCNSHDSASSSAVLGGDSNAHGCIASAGYSWCASKSKCIRPWEHNLMSEEDMAEHCGDGTSGHASENLELVGGRRDAHGCIGSAGYRWCASKSECIRPWEHQLTSEHAIAEHCDDSLSGGSMSDSATIGGRFVGGDRDAHGCIGSAGYTWCASMSECIRPWEHRLTSEQDIAAFCGNSP